MITQNIHTRSVLTVILISGLIVGTLDIVAAIVLSGVGTERLLKFVASGFFGKEKAAEGGLLMAAWGLLFHYIIAFSWTVLYFFIFPKMIALLKYRWLVALIYGLIIWVGMNRIVIPLSAIQQGPFNWIGFLRGSAVLIFMISVPLTWIYHAYFFPKQRT